ncbi:hypothetical protein EMCRGX_G003749 [Ephydatia muelleri]
MCYFATSLASDKLAPQTIKCYLSVFQMVRIVIRDLYVPLVDESDLLLAQLEAINHHITGLDIQNTGIHVNECPFGTSSSSTGDDFPTLKNNQLALARSVFSGYTVLTIGTETQSAYQARLSGRPASGQTPGWPTATLPTTPYSSAETPPVYVDRLYQQVIADAVEDSVKAAVERVKERPHYATSGEVRVAEKPHNAENAEKHAAEKPSSKKLAFLDEVQHQQLHLKYKYPAGCEDERTRWKAVLGRLNGKC